MAERGTKGAEGPSRRLVVDFPPSLHAAVRRRVREFGWRTGIGKFTVEAINAFVSKDGFLDFELTAVPLKDFLEGAKTEISLSGLFLPRRFQEEEFRRFIIGRLDQNVAIEVLMLNPQIEPNDAVYQVLQEPFYFLTGQDLQQDLQKTHQALAELSNLVESRRKEGKSSGSINVRGFRSEPSCDMAIVDRLSDQERIRVEFAPREFIPGPHPVIHISRSSLNTPAHYAFNRSYSNLMMSSEDLIPR